MNMQSRLSVKAGLVLALGFAALCNPKQAAAVPLPTCNAGPFCVNGSTCDEEVVRTVCNGLCPTWDIAVCYEPENSCGPNRIKIYCTADET